MQKEKNENKWLRLIYYLIILACIVGMVFQYSSKVITLYQKKNLKNCISKKVVYGNIREITHVTKSTRKWISYEFTYKNKNYSNKIMDVFFSKCGYDYDRKLFPIIIDSLQPEKNFILFHKRDYVYFGYSIPDSMNWLFNCVEPSGSYIFSPAPISPD
jgi:hypothetical protein